MVVVVITITVSIITMMPVILKTSSYSHTTNTTITTTTIPTSTITTITTWPSASFQLFCLLKVPRRERWRGLRRSGMVFIISRPWRRRPCAVSSTLYQQTHWFVLHIWHWSTDRHILVSGISTRSMILFPADWGHIRKPISFGIQDHHFSSKISTSSSTIVFLDDMQWSRLARFISPFLFLTYFTYFLGRFTIKTRGVILNGETWWVWRNGCALFGILIGRCQSRQTVNDHFAFCLGGGRISQWGSTVWDNWESLLINDLCGRGENNKL